MLRSCIVAFTLSLTSCLTYYIGFKLFSQFYYGYEHSTIPALYSHQICDLLFSIISGIIISDLLECNSHNVYLLASYSYASALTINLKNHNIIKTYNYIALQMTDSIRSQLASYLTQDACAPLSNIAISYKTVCSYMTISDHVIMDGPIQLFCFFSSP